MKLLKCPICREPYQKQNSLQKTCFQFDCIKAFLEKQKALKLAQEAKKQRKADKDMRLKIKTRSQWMRESQQWFNRFIRERDKGKPCIACNSVPVEKFGGNVDCSHYRSIGSAPHLRFHQDNAHSGCVKCNRYLSGNITEYRKGLIQRIGIERVDALESDQEPRKYTIPELQEIIAEYKQKLKNLVANQPEV